MMNNQSPGEAAEVVEVGDAPTPEEEELITWSARAQTTSLSGMQEALKQLMTVQVGLLGGSAALYAQIPTHWGPKAAAVVLLALSLACSLRGWHPWFVTYDPSRLDHIRRMRDELHVRKERWLKGSCVCLFFALCVVVSGVVLWPLPPAR